MKLLSQTYQRFRDYGYRYNKEKKEKKMKIFKKNFENRYKTALLAEL